MNVCDQNTFLGSGAGGATYVFELEKDETEHLNAHSILAKLSEDNLLLIASAGGGSGSAKSSIKSNGEHGQFFDEYIAEAGDANPSASHVNWKENTLLLLLNQTSPINESNCKGQSQRAGGFPGRINGCKHGKLDLFRNIPNNSKYKTCLFMQVVEAMAIERGPD